MVDANRPIIWGDFFVLSQSRHLSKFSFTKQFQNIDNKITNGYYGHLGNAWVQVSSLQLINTCYACLETFILLEHIKDNDEMNNKYYFFMFILSIFLIFNLTGADNMENKLTDQSSKTNTFFKETASYIFKHYKKPIKTGVENGVDITNFFSKEILKYTNHSNLINDLENQGFIVKVFQAKNYSKEQKEIVAVKHSSSFMTEFDRSICLKIILLDGIFISVKAVYFNSAQML